MQLEDVLVCSKRIDAADKIETIGDRCFASCYCLEGFYFGSNLTSIGSNAFGNCANLISIDMSSCTRLTSIGSNAFSDTVDWSQRDWSQPSEVLLPENLTTIGAQAFNNIGIATFICYMNPAPLATNIFGRTGQGTNKHTYTDKTVTCPAGSTGYDAWITALGSDWTLIES